jgi:hypothetical protein
MGSLGFFLGVYSLEVYRSIVLEVNLTGIVLAFLYFLVFLYIALIY